MAVAGFIATRPGTMLVNSATRKVQPMSTRAPTAVAVKPEKRAKDVGSDLECIKKARVPRDSSREGCSSMAAAPRGARGGMPSLPNQDAGRTALRDGTG